VPLCPCSVETHVAASFFRPTKRIRDTAAVACFSARFTARSLRKRISCCTRCAHKRPLHTTARRCGRHVLTSNACQCSARVDTARRRATASKCCALILEASEYTGCAKSSAMNAGRGRCPLLRPASCFLARFLLSSLSGSCELMVIVWCATRGAAAALKKGKMRWRRSAARRRL
jgi:hypothetical protein